MTRIKEQNACHLPCLCVKPEQKEAHLNKRECMPETQTMPLSMCAYQAINENDMKEILNRQAEKEERQYLN